ncbi:MAG: hypothetical protein ACLRVT_05170 [Oscillospiraceae bacterium]
MIANRLRAARKAAALFTAQFRLPTPLSFHGGVGFCVRLRDKLIISHRSLHNKGTIPAEFGTPIFLPQKVPSQTPLPLYGG